MIDTTDTSPMGNLLLNILAAVAEFEKGIIAERVRAGMRRAKIQGRRFGPAPKLDGDLEALIRAIRAGTLSRRQAARQLGFTSRRSPAACCGRVGQTAPRWSLPIAASTPRGRGRES